MKALELSFKGSDTRIKHLRLKYVNAELTPAEVESLMKQIATAKLFAKDGVTLYAEPHAANIVETTKTALVSAKPAVPAV
ncbi:DUF2922 domain-containing protein [Levilactobacillus fujinensis]|uniref:DUF2922 domain-containing protein n=1 Tax=Levilactobacillus fujinensis TaxID=2486024 RepID=A0ABW1THJ8_9LACO|nr:DUF2922 domain-containing protein [Levilactobacillus fujinensis]